MTDARLEALALEVLAISDQHEPPVALRPMLASHNAVLGEMPPWRDAKGRDRWGTIDGTTMLVDDRCVVMTHPRLRRYPSRRRYTAAHELGHLVLHCGSGSGRRLFLVGPAAGRDEAIEREANEFASMLLMPAPWLRADVARGELSFVGLATRYGVSKSALKWRLADLGLTVAETPPRPCAGGHEREGGASCCCQASASCCRLRAAS